MIVSKAKFKEVVQIFSLTVSPSPAPIAAHVLVQQVPMTSQDLTWEAKLVK